MIFQPIRIEFHIEPVAKGRPRFTRNGHAYTPEKTRNFEGALRVLWKQSGFEMIPKAPTSITVGFYLRRPKSVKKSVIVPIVRPDTDNFLKFLIDSLNGLAWADDSQITDLTAYKRYTVNQPKIVLAITPAIQGAA
jgi:Holliday junction resolvase RusA-like endonuclease